MKISDLLELRWFQMSVNEWDGKPLSLLKVKIPKHNASYKRMELVQLYLDFPKDLALSI